MEKRRLELCLLINRTAGELFAWARERRGYIYASRILIGMPTLLSHVYKK